MKKPISNFFIPLLAILLGFLLLSSCYSVPEVRVSDTSAQQAQVAEAEHSMESFPEDSNVGPKDAVRVALARAALETCEKTIKTKTDEAKDCLAKFKDLSDHYKDKDAKLEKLEQENGFFGRLDRFFSTVTIGIGIGIIGLLLAQEFGAALWAGFLQLLGVGFAAVRSRIP